MVDVDQFYGIERGESEDWRENNKATSKMQKTSLTSVYHRHFGCNSVVSSIGLAGLRDGLAQRSGFATIWRLTSPHA